MTTTVPSSTVQVAQARPWTRTTRAPATDRPHQARRSAEAAVSAYREAVVSLAPRLDQPGGVGRLVPYELPLIGGFGHHTGGEPGEPQQRRAGGSPGRRGA
ncbi:hypothetical protein ABT120_19370 [Nonomuraea angiospora]|uniref:hypothetical protein n=1 Tax=Nonomuraea angiospora TaxID=46172 RepID=UPI003332D190